MTFGVGDAEVIQREGVTLVFLQRDDLVVDLRRVVDRLDLHLDRADLATRTTSALFAVPATVAVRHVVGNGHALRRVLRLVRVGHLAQHVVHVRAGGHRAVIPLLGREADGHAAVDDGISADRALAIFHGLVDDAVAVLPGHKTQAVAVVEAVDILGGGSRILAMTTVLATNVDGGTGPVAQALVQAVEFDIGQGHVRRDADGIAALDERIALAGTAVVLHAQLRRIVDRADGDAEGRLGAGVLAAIGRAAVILHLVGEADGPVEVRGRREGEAPALQVLAGHGEPAVDLLLGHRTAVEVQRAILRQARDQHRLQVVVLGIAEAEVRHLEGVDLVLVDAQGIAARLRRVVHRRDVHGDLGGGVLLATPALLPMPAAVAVRHADLERHAFRRVLGPVAVGHQVQDVVDILAGRNSAAISILGREGDDQLAGVGRAVVTDDALDLVHRLDDLAVAEAQAGAGIVLEAEHVVGLGMTSLAVAVPAVSMIIILAADGDRSAGPVAQAAIEGVQFDIGNLRAGRDPGRIATFDEVDTAIRIRERDLRRVIHRLHLDRHHRDFTGIHAVVRGTTVVLDLVTEGHRAVEVLVRTELQATALQVIPAHQQALIDLLLRQLAAVVEQATLGCRVRQRHDDHRLELIALRVAESEVAEVEGVAVVLCDADGVVACLGCVIDGDDLDLQRARRDAAADALLAVPAIAVIQAVLQLDAFARVVRGVAVGDVLQDVIDVGRRDGDFAILRTEGHDQFAALLAERADLPALLVERTVLAHPVDIIADESELVR